MYGACVGNALKWFPDRRGFAAGVTAMGFGAGSALTVYPIANMIQSQGYEAAFLKFGLSCAVIISAMRTAIAHSACSVPSRTIPTAAPA